VSSRRRRSTDSPSSSRTLDILVGMAATYLVVAEVGKDCFDRRRQTRGRLSVTGNPQVAPEDAAQTSRNAPDGRRDP
jgi:hypothetical protein